MTYSFPNMVPVRHSIFNSNSCFLTCIQISQEAGKVVWYSPLFQNFPQLDTIKGSGLRHGLTRFVTSENDKQQFLVAIHNDHISFSSLQSVLEDIRVNCQLCNRGMDV